MKIVFMGTPDFSVPVLKELISKHNVVAVYTRAPKESGRGKKVSKTPVHIIAEETGIPIHTPRSLKGEEEQEILRSYHADVIVVAAYGLILPQTVLDMFPYGCINVHASLLPRWRGAAPIQRSIEAGDKESGISIMQMALALDAGDILAQKSTKITSTTTGGILHDKLSQIGADLLLDTLNRLDKIVPQKQDENLVTYAEKIDKSECLIDFDMSAEQLEKKIRAFAPYPAMYFIYNGWRFKVLLAQVVDIKAPSGQIVEGMNDLVIGTGTQSIKVLYIQREGKQAMMIKDLLRGFHFEKGMIL